MLIDDVAFQEQVVPMLEGKFEISMPSDLKVSDPPDIIICDEAIINDNFNLLKGYSRRK